MPSFYLSADNFDFVTVSGPDATRFLQGQVTCDVEKLQTASLTKGAVCNIKGRVLTVFHLLRLEEQLILIFSKGLGEVFINTLKKFLPFYKCTMQLETNPDGLALAGQEALSALLPDTAMLTANQVLATGTGWVAILSTSPLSAISLQNSTQVIAKLKQANVPSATLAQWQVLGLEQGIFPFTLADSEQYTPQELGYDQLGFVSFSKGCYTGQEIVARMHYRGKIKKALYLAVADIAAEPEADKISLYGPGGEILGQSLKQVIVAPSSLYSIFSLPLDMPLDLANLNLSTGSLKALTVLVKP